MLTIRKQEAERARAEAVVRLLLDWADWMKGYHTKLGFGTKSAGLQSGFVSASFDEMCEQADYQRNEIVDSCVNDLPPNQSAAIHHRYCASVYRMRDYEGSLLDAHERLTVTLRSKGVLW